MKIIADARITTTGADGAPPTTEKLVNARGRAVYLQPLPAGAKVRDLVKAAEKDDARDYIFLRTADGNLFAVTSGELDAKKRIGLPQSGKIDIRVDDDAGSVVEGEIVASVNNWQSGDWADLNEGLGMTILIGVPIATGDVTGLLPGALNAMLPFGAAEGQREEAEVHDPGPSPVLERLTSGGLNKGQADMGAALAPRQVAPKGPWRR